MLKSLGSNLQAIYMTMLGLVALYLFAVHARDFNVLVKSIGGTAERSLVILQGRNPNRVL